LEGFEKNLKPERKGRVHTDEVALKGERKKIYGYNEDIKQRYKVMRCSKSF